MTTNKLPPSLIEQAIWLVKELGISPDQPTSHDYGRLTSNLAMLKMSAVPDEDFDKHWAMLLDNVMYPDDRDFPHNLFLLPQKELVHYKLLLGAVDDIYQKYGE